MHNSEVYYYCPRCHHPIRNPRNGEFSGEIIVNCPNCGKGKVTIKGNIKQE